MAEAPTPQKTNDFFNGDTPHGLVKRYMLKYFLQAFLPSAQRHTPPIQVTIIDGFAGVGRYSWSWPASIEQYGSPIIALRVAIEEAATRQNIPISFHNDKNDQMSFKVYLSSVGIEPYLPAECNLENFKPTCVETNVYLQPEDAQVTLVFVEARPKNYKKLVRNVFKTFLRYGIRTRVCFTPDKHVNIKSVENEFQIECILVCAKFEHIHPPEIDGKLFTFIDPFGYSHTPFEAVQRFIGPNKEVYINFMSSYINRFARCYPMKVAELFGVETPDEEDIGDFVNYIRQYTEGNEPTDNTVHVMETYIQNIKKTGVGYQLAFEMRGKRNNIIYHLLYLSDDIKYVRQMKESFNRGAQEPTKLALSDYYIEKKGMCLNLKNNQNEEDVANAIFEKFAGMRISIDDIDTYVTVDTPYVFRKKPLAKLQKRGQIFDVTNYEGEGQERRFTFPEKDQSGNKNDWKMTFRQQE